VAAKAVDALEGVLEASNATHASKVAAARAVLELAQERIDTEEILERLEALEGGAPPPTPSWEAPPRRPELAATEEREELPT
jgi:hypothetical protein